MVVTALSEVHLLNFFFSCWSLLLGKAIVGKKLDVNLLWCKSVVLRLHTKVQIENKSQQCMSMQIY